MIFLKQLFIIYFFTRAEKNVSVKDRIIFHRVTKTLMFSQVAIIPREILLDIYFKI